MALQLRQWLKRSRAFFFALFAVVVVWIVSAMSEHNTFRESYSLNYVGIDTARYAITAIDSTLLLDISSNGFHAFQRSVHHSHKLTIDISPLLHSDSSGQLAIEINTAEILDSLRNQLDMRNVSNVAAVMPTLQIRMAERMSKSFTPDINKVQFLFDGTAGLCGQPSIRPGKVTLYGSQESLAKIDHISAKEQVVKNIRSSGHYKVTLDDQWKEFPDLRISSPTIDVFLPVERFIEHKFSLPITLPDDDAGLYHLYPDHVTLTALIPLRDYSKIRDTDFTVASLPINDTAGMLPLAVKRFPVNVRIKSISPQQVQYVIIKQ